MDNFKYRTSSRIFATVDAILSSIGFLALVILAVDTTENFSSIQNKDLEERADKDDMVASMLKLYIGVGIVSIIFSLNLWAIIMFLKATKEGADYVEAARRARIWRDLNIVFVILSLLNIFLPGSYIRVLVALAYRGIILINISSFINELDEAVATRGLGNLDNAGVVVNL